MKPVTLSTERLVLRPFEPSDAPAVHTACQEPDIPRWTNVPSLARLHTPERQAELGYWAAKEQRGRGYTVEAARAVLGWAFRDLGVERMEWHAEAGNEGSRAVARKLGFRMEGTLRAKLVREGTRRDIWIGSLLPSDLPEEPGPSGSDGPAAPDATPYLPYPG
ncbi:acetyltransferase [Streptomyces platensis subsp. clarensis]|nr:acetyltransferase [Streptomyces platensis subsp. clarensis]